MKVKRVADVVDWQHRHQGAVTVLLGHRSARFLEPEGICSLTKEQRSAGQNKWLCVLGGGYGWRGRLEVFSLCWRSWLMATAADRTSAIHYTSTRVVRV